MYYVQVLQKARLHAPLPDCITNNAIPSFTMPFVCNSRNYRKALLVHQKRSQGEIKRRLFRKKVTAPNLLIMPKPSAPAQPSPSSASPPWLGDSYAWRSRSPTDGDLHQTFGPSHRRWLTGWLAGWASSDDSSYCTVYTRHAYRARISFLTLFEM